MPRKARTRKTTAASGAPHPDPGVWIRDQAFRTTADVEVPKALIDQVIGQERAVQVALKAAEQNRHLLLIGDPGTGKSMLAKAMAEVLPAGKQDDTLAYHNEKNPNQPRIVQVPGGDGRKIVQEAEAKAHKSLRWWRLFTWGLGLAFIGFGVTMWILTAQVLVFLFALLIALLFVFFAGQKAPKIDFLVPRLLVAHPGPQAPAPYVDATGSHAGALLGDVRHDPFQSGGLETPPHARVEIGAIHRAHKGVLYVDEINVLRLESQQALLTALQDKKYSIVGQSQSSSGAMIRTEPVACDFILVAAGNLDAVNPPVQGGSTGMHPALRSRIRGYGYEVFVASVMDDNHTNRKRLVQFVAQEVERDGKIPHFEPAAVAEVIREAQRRAGESGKLTLRLRELGGLVRTAGDVARSEDAAVVTDAHVRAAKQISRSLEQQITATDLERHQAREARQTRGEIVGTAKGVALVGTGEVGEPAGVLVPVEAATVPSRTGRGGNVVLGESLRPRAGGAVENVAPVLRRLVNGRLEDLDVHVDGLVPHPHAEVDGVAAAVALAALSALEDLPLRQDTVVIGTLAVNGDLRYVRGCLQRIEAAASVGYRHALVPEDARADVTLDPSVNDRIHVVYVRSIRDALDHVLATSPERLRSLRQRFDAPRMPANGHLAPPPVRVAAKNARKESR